MNKKAFYISINVVLHILGFPLLFILALVKSLQWNSYGMYGANSFAPVYVVLVLWAIIALIQFLILYFARKKGKNGTNLMLKTACVPVIVTILLFGIFDICLPPILERESENTILYEDVVDDYQGLHEELVGKVNQFKIKYNTAHPEDKIDTNATYDSKEFQDKFQPLFKSMDDAYNSYDKLAIAIALKNPDLLKAIKSGEMPIPVAATLILKTDARNKNNHYLTTKELLMNNLTTLTNALGDFKEINFDTTNSEKINEIVNEAIVYKDFDDGYKWNIFNILGTNILAPNVDPNAGNGALGYQDMAWLNKIPAMVFIPLMSIRKTCYIFAGVLAFISFAAYVVEDMYFKKFGKYMLDFKKKN